MKTVWDRIQVGEKKLFVQQIVQGFKLWSSFEVTTIVPGAKPDLTLSGVTGLNLDCPAQLSPAPPTWLLLLWTEGSVDTCWRRVKGVGGWRDRPLRHGHSFFSFFFKSTSSTKKGKGNKVGGGAVEKKPHQFKEGKLNNLAKTGEQPISPSPYHSKLEN